MEPARADWVQVSKKSKRLIMALNVQSLKEILRAKGSLTISANGLYASSLKELATEAANSGAHLTIKNCGELYVSSLKEVAIAGKGYVTFDIT